MVKIVVGVPIVGNVGPGNLGGSDVVCPVIALQVLGLSMSSSSSGSLRSEDRHDKNPCREFL